MARISLSDVDMDRRRFLAAAGGMAALTLAGCGSGLPTPAEPGQGGAQPSGAKKKKLTIGLVAKSNSNAVFQVARTAAEQTAKALSAKEGIEIAVEWRTPDQENSQEQARNIEALAGLCDGISVSCTDGDALVTSINAATDRGVPVMTFDSDSPKSKRICYFGTDDADLGLQLAAELVKVMGEKGSVGIIAGNQNAPNLRKRVDSVREGLKKYPGITLAGPTNGAFYHEETAQAAAAAWAAAHTANPGITGWILVGGWPLFTQGATKALGEPGKVKVVSCDSLPETLGYLRDGSVQTLLGQDLYGWGEQSVRILVEKALRGTNPPSQFVYGKLTAVTKADVDAYAKNWDVWLPKK